MKNFKDLKEQSIVPIVTRPKKDQPSSTIGSYENPMFQTTAEPRSAEQLRRDALDFAKVRDRARVFGSTPVPTVNPEGKTTIRRASSFAYNPIDQEITKGADLSNLNLGTQVKNQTTTDASGKTRSVSAQEIEKRREDNLKRLQDLAASKGRELSLPTIADTVASRTKTIETRATKGPKGQAFYPTGTPPTRGERAKIFDMDRDDPKLPGASIISPSALGGTTGTRDPEQEKRVVAVSPEQSVLPSMSARREYGLSRATAQKSAELAKKSAEEVKQRQQAARTEYGLSRAAQQREQERSAAADEAAKRARELERTRADLDATRIAAASAAAAAADAAQRRTQELVAARAEADASREASAATISDLQKSLSATRRQAQQSARTEYGVSRMAQQREQERKEAQTKLDAATSAISALELDIANVEDQMRNAGEEKVSMLSSQLAAMAKALERAEAERDTANRQLGAAKHYHVGDEVFDLTTGRQYPMGGGFANAAHAIDHGINPLLQREDTSVTFKELRQRLDELTVKLGDPVIDPKEAEALMQKQRAMSPDAFFLKRLAGVETRLPDFGTDEATEKAKEMTPGQIAGQRIYAGIRAYDRLHGTVLKQPRGSFSGDNTRTYTNLHGQD